MAGFEKKPYFSNLSFSSWRHNTQTRGKVSREDKINIFFRKTPSQVELSMNDLRELLLLICTNTSQHCRHTPHPWILWSWTGRGGKIRIDIAVCASQWLWNASTAQQRLCKFMNDEFVLPRLKWGRESVSIFHSAIKCSRKSRDLEYNILKLVFAFYSAFICLNKRRWGWLDLYFGLIHTRFIKNDGRFIVGVNFHSPRRLKVLAEHQLGP